MSKAKPSVDDYLKEPYTRILVPDAESGTFAAEILEFPGCVSQGDTPAEAYANLEDAAKSWLEATLRAGQNVPKPFDTDGYSGRVALRIPRSLHRQAAQFAELEGTSLNQFIVSAVAEKVGAANLYSFISNLAPLRPTVQANISVMLMSPMQSPLGLATNVNRVEMPRFSPMAGR